MNHNTIGGVSWSLVSLISILCVAVVGSTLAIAMRSDEYRFFDPLVAVKAEISKNYVEEIDDADLQRAAIDGMLDVLGDPYTVYVPASEAGVFNKNLTGEYVGIGAEVNMPDGWLMIASPLEDSPAWKAGVMAGDKITHIEGESTFELSVDDCVDRLTGEPNTPVTVTIERDGEVFDLTIVRQHIKTHPVKGLRRAPGNETHWLYLLDAENKIAYIRLTQFTPGASEEVRRAIEAAKGEAGGDLGGLVLDLRWNPGGMLDEAIKIADLFLDEGVIVSTRGRAFPERTAEAGGDGTLGAFAMTVLINGQSASASEVLSGALVEHGRAVAVGERTFGKGSVQSVKPLSEGAGMLKITQQRYFLPSGRSIHRLDDSAVWGVDPSPGYFVPLEREELLELWEVRRERETLRSTVIDDSTPEHRWDDPAWVLDQLADRQLGDAVGALQEHVEGGAWPEVPEAEADAIDQAELRGMLLARERIMRELARVDRRIDAIETRVVDADAVADEIDLWDDAAAIIGGRVSVTGADGGVLRELEITGPNLERWLMDADLEPLGVMPGGAVVAPEEMTEDTGGTPVPRGDVGDGDSD